MSDLEAQLRAYGALLDRSRFDVADVVDAGPRPARRSLIVAVAAAVVVAIAVSTVAVVATRSSGPRRPNIVTPPSTTVPISPPRAPGVLAIGDSVMLGAKASLQATIPGIAVDAVLSRQVAQAVNVLDLYDAAGTLPGTIVIDLGTNGRATTEALDAIMRAARGREVYFVTVRVPRLWESDVNAALGAVPRRRPNAHVIDWREFSSGHDGWFVADGFHLSSAGRQAYATLIASAIGRLPAPPPPDPSGLKTVAVITKTQLPPGPLAVAGGLVWIATESPIGAPFVRLEGRDPTTTDVVRTIDVPQEAVFAVAGAGDVLWVAGGGDGGVPETTVSKVDTATGRVVFTKTLTGTPCSCPIFAGDAGVWLVGNSSDFALHLSETDGHVLANVQVPFARTGVTAAMETRGRLLLGPSNGSVVVVDPLTNRIERSLDAGGSPSSAPVMAMSAATIPAVGTDPAIDGLIVHADKSVFALLADSWQANKVVLTGFVPTTVVGVRNLVWILGSDRLEVAATHAVVSNGFAYDAEEHTFTRVAQSSVTPEAGFRDAVALRDTVWVVYDDGSGTVLPSVVVIEAPEDFPFK